MRFVLFCHSLVSDWNHGNAHFLRGVVRELRARGHEVRVFEPRGGWSRTNLVAEQGEGALGRFERAFPGLRSTEHEPATLDLDAALDGADVVLVHEWTEPELVARIGAHRARGGGRYLLLFHDTHHRSVSAPEAMAAYDLDGFDGVLAFGEAVREVYLRRGWARRAWTWHEAADVALFRPMPAEGGRDGDLVWIGNWGDGERAEELRGFLLDPVRRLGLTARIYGVRYPEDALRALERAGVAYGGWLPNAEVPSTFARYAVTAHVPRRYYATALPGIPTIRVFEALACGIPLVSAPWRDTEGLFRPGTDYLIARDGNAMTRALRDVLADPDLAAELARNGLARVRERHTCGHRVDELLAIRRGLGVGQPEMASAGAA
ncbi:MAG TPA: glycosyltransferase [Geminicoccaceae bacterium]|nr:glycosyltransferase [Geminicoccaceae bacterium]